MPTPSQSKLSDVIFASTCTGSPGNPGLASSRLVSRGIPDNADESGKTPSARVRDLGEPCSTCYLHTLLLPIYILIGRAIPRYGCTKVQRSRGCGFIVGRGPGNVQSFALVVRGLLYPHSNCLASDAAGLISYSSVNCTCGKATRPIGAARRILITGVANRGVGGAVARRASAQLGFARLPLAS